MFLLNRNKVMNEENDALPSPEAKTETKVKPDAEVHLDSSKSAETQPLKSSYVRFLNTYPKSILVFFVLISIGIGYYGFGVFSVLSGGGFDDPHSESVLTQNYFKRYDNVSADADLLVLMEHPEWTVDDARFSAAYFDLKNNLVTAFPLSKIQSYFDYPDESGGLVSNDRHMALMMASLPDDIVDYKNKPIITADDLEDQVGDNPLKITFGGGMLSSEEVDETISKDLEKLEFGAFPVLIVLLILAHGGLVAISAPVALIIWTILCTFAALRLVAIGFNVTTYVTNVTTVFGIGLAMDFTLFTQLRFYEELRRHESDAAYTPAHAVEKMLSTSGMTVLFSCIMIICTMVAALQFSEYFVTTMALAILFPALFAAIGALTIVPTMYIAMGRNLFLLSTSTAIDATAQWMRRSDANKGSVFATVDTAEPEQSLELVPTADADPEAALEAKNDQQHGPQTEHVSSRDSATESPVGDIEGGAVSQRDSDPAAQDHDAPVLQLHDATKPGGSEKSEKSVGSPKPVRWVMTPAEEAEDKEIRAGVWFRMVTFVMQHPLIFLISVLGCLIGLMYVFFTKAQFANMGFGNLPLDSPSRYIIETTQSSFPTSNGKGSFDVYMQTIDPLGIRSPEFLALMDNYCAALEANTRFIVDVTSLTNFDSSKNLTEYQAYYADPYSPAHYNFTRSSIDPYGLTNLQDVVHVSVSLSIQPSDPKLGEVVRFVRRLTAESFYDSNGVLLLSKWGTAGDAQQFDVNKDIGETIPYAIAVIVPTVYVFVLLLTGSVLIPVKAIITSFLSLCGSFGFLVLIIQEGHGSDLLQFRNNLACIDPLQLIFIFLVALGLSLDYEIFMLGRVQEIYRKTGDNNYAVARGIETSARSVTMAALLLCTAVGGFLAAEILLLKQIGVGIGLTIVLDATVVRCVFVPSVLALMGGKASWYAPKPVTQFVEWCGLLEEE